MKNIPVHLLCIVIVLFFSSIARAQQRLEMEGTAIIGNKELPKVLYIVPWKEAENIRLSTPPFDSVLDEPFQAVERTTFNRQIKFYNDLYASPDPKP